MGQKASMKAANGLGAGWPKADLRLAQSELERGAGRIRSTACRSTLGRDGGSARRRRCRGGGALVAEACKGRRLGRRERVLGAKVPEIRSIARQRLARLAVDSVAAIGLALNLLNLPLAIVAALLVSSRAFATDGCFVL